MTTIRWDWQESHFYLTVEGHAGPPGAVQQDETHGNIVCAGVSMLVQALAAWILTRQEAADADIHILECSKGRAAMDVCFAPHIQAHAQGAIGLALEGFRLLAAQYPAYVKLLMV